jgi:hypothetical protein
MLLALLEFSYIFPIFSCPAINLLIASSLALSTVMPPFVISKELLPEWLVSCLAQQGIAIYRHNA